MVKTYQFLSIILSALILVHAESDVLEISSKEMFDKTIADIEKSVLVEFYAPW
jgi:hypothetical protein